MFGEPAPTPYDLQFRLLGFPVRVHPFFWVFTALLSGAHELRSLVLWVAAVFAAILFHEMGHAVVLRWLGNQPWIVLYGLGGVTMHQPGWGRRGQSAGSEILVAAAGPPAGFLLAGWLVATLWLAHVPLLRSSWFGIPVFQPVLESPVLAEFLGDLILVCIVWGVFNLLPIYPLDGGQITRQVMGLVSPRHGLRWSLIGSIAAAGLLAAYYAWGLLQFARLQLAILGRLDLGGLFQDGGVFNLLLFSALAYMNYQSLQEYKHRGF